MRTNLKSLLIAGLFLSITIAGGAAWIVSTGLPWRGTLARHLYAEVLRGRMPMVRCEAVVQWGLRRHGGRPVRGDVPANGFHCSGLSSDARQGAMLVVRDGSVHSLRRMWWRPMESGRSFADSVAKELAGSNGAMLRCRMQPVTGNRGHDESHLLFQHADDEHTRTELHARSGVPWTEGGAIGWVVSIEETQEGASDCVPL